MDKIIFPPSLQKKKNSLKFFQIILQILLFSYDRYEI